MRAAKVVYGEEAIVVITQKKFVHLHVHSEYSILDGSIKIKKLVKELAKRQEVACALTDHDAMHGVLEFYLACQAEKINGIIGYEVNVSFFSSVENKKVSHLILLAENNTGYQNLLKICTIANTVNKDQVYPDSTSLSLDEIKPYCEGLICLTGCLSGELATLLLEKKHQEADLYIDKLLSIFGKNNIFIELIDNGMSQQAQLIPALVDFAKQKQLPIVATADVHYLFKKDKETHMSLLAIKHKLQKNDVKNIPEEIDFHLASEEEMIQKFELYPEALSNTLAIAARCQITIDTKSIFMPDYRQKEDESSDDCLVRLSREGLEARKEAVQRWMGDLFDESAWKEYESRLEYELSVILKMKFSGYFLIVQDFINWAKEQKIPVGPGRGSAAGSLVTYALRITNIDPIRFNLLFERFLNPERISMPDIDTDFCQDRRDEVLKYVYQKYGHRAVSQIVTFGRMMARNAIKNLARINGWSFGESNDFAKLIPETPGITLEQALQEEPKIKERLSLDERADALWNGALEIEGTLSALGIHAAGVIISDRALDERCPLLESEGQLLTQFENKYAEKVGLIKFDFLGLKTLTVIDHAVKLIAKTKGIFIDIESIDVDDPKVYEMISTANVTGIFQLESQGMRKLISHLKPTCFTDIIAVLALFRPGPLGSGMVDDFVKRKHGETSAEYFFPELEPILKDTYGVIVYQEQVQKIAAVLANYSLGEADLLRRAMGKKDKNEMERQKSRFVQGAEQNNHDPQKAADLFDLMAKFAEYGFNKSHTAAYGWVTFQTAWLKTYYPMEFMTSIMSCDLDNTDKIVTYVKDCKRMGLPLFPPDVNHSYFDFTIRDQGIQFALGAIKGLGENIANTIAEERLKNGPYQTVPEFIARVDARKLNKKFMECLVKSGAFDALATNRGQLFAHVEPWLKTIAKEMENAHVSAFSLFGDYEVPSKVKGPSGVLGKSSEDDFIESFYLPNRLPIRICPETALSHIKNALRGVQIVSEAHWNFQEYLTHEFSVLGFHLSAQPTDRFKSDYQEFSEISLDKVHHMCEPPSVPDFKRKVVKIAGMITQLMERRTKEGKAFLVLVLDDGCGELELVLYSQQLEALTTPLSLFDSLVVECKIKAGIEEGTVKGVIQSVSLLSEKRIDRVKKLILKSTEYFVKDKSRVLKLKEMLEKHKGKTPVFFKIRIKEEEVFAFAKLTNYPVSVSDELLLALENEWPGVLVIERVYSHDLI